MNQLIFVSGILLVILGVCSFFMPMQILTWMAIVISVAVLVEGVVALVNFFTAAKPDRSGWVLMEGCISIVFGIWMLLGSGISVLAAVIPYGFAVVIAASGGLRIAEAFQIKKETDMMWGWLLCFGMLAVVFGVLLLFVPATSAKLLWVTVSLLITCHGISNIALYIDVRRTGRFIRKGVQLVKDGKSDKDR